MSELTATPALPDIAAMTAAAEHLFQRATGHIVSSGLYVAVSLGIPDLLAHGPQSADALGRDTSTNQYAIARLLRTLADAGILDEGPDGQFTLTSAGQLLRSDSSPSLKAFVSWIANPFHFLAYADLTYSILTGEAAVEKVFGASVFEVFAQDPALRATFDEFITAFAGAVAPAVLGAYDFSGIRQLVDVGGAHGHLLMSILQRYPKLKGVVFDVESMAEAARRRVGQEQLSDRCEVVAGDFFDCVPSGDAYLLKHIIHDWKDERALTILRNVRRAAGNSQARVLLIESIVGSCNRGDVRERIALEMLAVHGGRERTQAEFNALLHDADWRLSRVIPMRSSLSVIEAFAR